MLINIENRRTYIRRCSGRRWRGGKPWRRFSQVSSNWEEISKSNFLIKGLKRIISCIEFIHFCTLWFWSVIITLVVLSLLILMILNLYLMIMMGEFEVLEHKIEAAEIAILAKSYIKRFDHQSWKVNPTMEVEKPIKWNLKVNLSKINRFDHESGTFIELHEVHWWRTCISL